MTTYTNNFNKQLIKFHYRKVYTVSEGRNSLLFCILISFSKTLKQYRNEKNCERTNLICRIRLPASKKFAKNFLFPQLVTFYLHFQGRFFRASLPAQQRMNVNGGLINSADYSPNLFV